MTGGNPSKRKHQHQISSEEVTIKHTKHDRWKIANFVMISTTATQTQSLPTAELLDVLECPVCKILPRTTPIYQCENGHIYCNECKPNLRTCAVCRVTLGDIRSLICEQVIERYVFILRLSKKMCGFEGFFNLLSLTATVDCKQLILTVSTVGIL